MFNLLSSALQSAVETVAPSAPVTEDLKYHWRKITHFYSTHTGSNFTDRVEATRIPSHLREILVLLVEEHATALIQGGGKEESGSQNEPGPCMETVLELRVFQGMAEYARTDWPSGIKCHILRFFTEILDMGIPASILPHNAVFGPLMETIQICGETNASPYEKEELEFLKAISLKLKQFTDLAPCFLRRLEEEDPNVPEIERNPRLVDPEKAYFPIVRSFLTLMMSADYWVVVEASQALLEFSSCLDDWLSPALVAPITIILPENGDKAYSTTLPQFLIERIKESFCLLPPDLDPDQLEESNWREGYWKYLAKRKRLVRKQSKREGIKMDDDSVTEDGDEDWLRDLKSLGSKAKEVWDSFDTTVSGVVDDALGVAGESASRLAKGALELLNRGIQQLQFEFDLDVNASPSKSNSSIDESEAAADAKSKVLEPTSRKVLSYLSRLDLADVFAASTPDLAARKIGDAFASEFLRGAIEPRLLDAPDALLATSHLTKVLQQVSSSVFLEEISSWLLGTRRCPELRGGEIHPLKATLLARCSQNDDVALALETLRLFEVLLQKPCEHMIYNLALTNLVDRSYVDLPRLENQCSSWSDEEDEREKKRQEIEAFSPNSTPRSRTLAPSRIQKIVGVFLEMVPDCLRSCQDEDMGRSGVSYEQYLADAHRHTRNALGQCRNFAWPREATLGVVTSSEDPRHRRRRTDDAEGDENSSSDSRPEADHFRTPTGSGGGGEDDGRFYEGRFLEMVLNRFESLLDQPYELSLQVTSVLATLAALPHPHLHEFLLNPLLPPAEGARTLPVLLQKMIDEIQIVGSEIPNFHRQLCQTRCILVSGDEPGDDEPLSSIGEKHPSLFEGAIVIEEFCKELGALAFAKYQQCSC